MKVLQKVIVVTGGGSGIGRELVLQLLDRGAQVAAVDRDAASLEELGGLAGARADSLGTFALDVTDRAAVEALPERVIERFGAVDGLINNAGIIQPFVRLKELDYEAIDGVMAVNFQGTLYMTKAFLPHLLERPEGHIANISSMGGFLPVPGQTIYGASKAAVKLLTEGLWSELADTSVRVTIVFPGAIATDIAARSGIETPAGAEGPSFPMLPADRAAKDILDGIERDAFRVLVGRDARMMDRLYRLAPKRAASLIFRQMRALLPA